MLPHLKKTLLFLILISFSSVYAEDINYRVQFEGIQETDILSTLKSVSELVILQDSPPATITALKRRAEADLPNLVHGLQSFGYYNAKINLNIEEEALPITISICIELGSIYPLESFCIVPDPERDCDESRQLCEKIKIDRLGIALGKPALPKTILEAENKILQVMADKAHPLASITKHEIIADQAVKTIGVTVYLDPGPLAYFGNTTFSGLKTVKEFAIQKKISWCPGDLYNPSEIEYTLNNIEASGLFSAVTIDSPDEICEDGTVPMNIEVIESRHRTIGGGISFNTQVGPGVIGTWENRNIRGLGEKVTFHADIAQKRQVGLLSYRQPDFLVAKQDLIWITELESEQTRGFSDTAFSFSGLVDKEISERIKFSYGGTIKQLHTEKSNNNNQFVLLKSPLFFRWTTSNDLLDPTKGRSLILRLIPTVQIIHPKVSYCINTLTATIYKPLRKDRRLVIASKATLGSIWGASDIRIPPPERFYVGSESTLRGYNYLTVSPLGPNKKPIGGRSMMVFTLEGRIRVTELFGIVGFYEIGNTYLNILPQFEKKQRQSIGMGLRYHTPVGPLRFDLAFPLNRRPGIDRSFQFYLSIGQAF